MSTEFKQLERVDREAAYELQKRVNQIRQEAANAANRAREQAERSAQSQINSIKLENAQREQRIINELRSDTNNKLAQQEANHRAALLQLNSSLQNQLNKQATDFRDRLDILRQQNIDDIENLRNETNELIDELTEEMQGAFERQDEINVQHQTQINNIKGEVRNLQLNISNQIAWAKETLVECKRNSKEMDQNIAVRRFQGSELERVKKSISNAESLIESAPQAAIGNLTEAFIELMDIREKALISQVIFEKLYEQSLSGIKALIEKSKQNKAETKVGKTSVDLNFWTQGKYAEFEEKVSNLEKEVNAALNDSNVNSNTLTEILKQISILEAQEEILVIEAVKNIELSQNRVETADKIISKLQNEGNFIIKKDDDEGYIAKDYREGYYATLVDRNNQDISISVLIDSELDDSDNSLKNRISIQRNDKTHINPALVEEYRDIIESGLKEGDSDVIRQKVSDEQVFDPNAIKNTKLTNEQKKKLRK